MLGHKTVIRLTERVKMIIPVLSKWKRTSSLPYKTHKKRKVNTDHQFSPFCVIWVMMSGEKNHNPGLTVGADHLGKKNRVQVARRRPTQLATVQYTCIILF